jgi:hypothetical protein
MVQLIIVMINRLFQKRDLPRELPFSRDTFRQLLFGLTTFSLHLTDLILMVSESYDIFFMLLLDLFQMSHQNGILSHQQAVLLL